MENIPLNEMQYIIKFIAILVALYLLPTWVAIARKHSNTLPIFFLNLFLGWSLLGWVAALIWASVSMPKFPLEKLNSSFRSHDSERPENSSDVISQLQTAKNLLDQNVITREEFERLKRASIMNG